MAALSVRGYDVTRIRTGQDGRRAGGFGNIGYMETRHTLTSNGNGGPGLALNNRRRALAGRVEHLYGGGGGTTPRAVAGGVGCVLYWGLSPSSCWEF